MKACLLSVLFAGFVSAPGLALAGDVLSIDTVQQVTLRNMGDGPSAAFELMGALSKAALATVADPYDPMIFGEGYFAHSGYQGGPHATVQLFVDTRTGSVETSESGKSFTLRGPIALVIFGALQKDGHPVSETDLERSVSGRFVYCFSPKVPRLSEGVRAPWCVFTLSDVESPEG